LQYYERQREVYEEQIAKLSYQETDSNRNKLTVEIDLKYQNILKQKDMEMDNLNDQIFEWKKKFEIILIELDTTKSQLNKEIDILKENYRSEIKEYNFKIQLLNEKNEINNEKENLRTIKNELEISRKNILDLQSELQNLRKEKEVITKEKLENNLNINKQLEKLKLDIAIKNAENERILNSFKLIENENYNLRNKFDNKNNEIKNLVEDKMNLFQSNFNKENLIENLKTEISTLKKKYDDKDFEYIQLEKISMEKDKNNFIKEKKEREDYQNKIDELTNKLRESKIDLKNLDENSINKINVLIEEIGLLKEEKKFYVSKEGKKGKKNFNKILIKFF
jgi:hypothetical protein